MDHHHPATPYKEHAHARRRQAMLDFWRDAEAAWARVQHSAASRLARSTQRLQARLQRHQAGRTGAAARSA